MKSSVWTVLLSLIVVATAVAQPQKRLDVSEMPRPIEALDSVWIEELTTLEVRDAMRGGKTIALILTGGIEQNGPYLATGKHNYVLRVMGEKIARELGNALIAPMVTLEPGDPEKIHHPGTVYLSKETYKAVLKDMATSLKTQGFEHVFLMGDSGGNQTSMQEVADELKVAWDGGPTGFHFIREYYDYVDRDVFMKSLGVHEVYEGLHDSFHVTSIMMNGDPTTVRMEQRIEAGNFSINGVDLAPAETTIATGKRIIDYRAAVTLKAIRKALEGSASN